MGNLISINPRTTLVSIGLFFVLDLLASGSRSFGQYLSLEVYIYNLSGSTHWSNIVFKLFFPVIISAIVFFLTFRLVSKPDEKGSENSFACIEESVALGVLFSSIVIAWPSLRYPDLLFIDFNYLGIVFSNIFFCVAFPLFAVFGLRLCRSFFHPEIVETHYPKKSGHSFLSESVTPLLGGIVSAVVGSIFAIALGV